MRRVAQNSVQVFSDVIRTTTLTRTLDIRARSVGKLLFAHGRPGSRCTALDHREVPTHRVRESCFVWSEIRQAGRYDWVKPCPYRDILLDGAIHTAVRA